MPCLLEVSALSQHTQLLTGLVQVPATCLRPFNVLPRTKGPTHDELGREHPESTLELDQDEEVAVVGGGLRLGGCDEAKHLGMIDQFHVRLHSC